MKNALPGLVAMAALSLSNGAIASEKTNMDKLAQEVCQQQSQFKRHQPVSDVVSLEMSTTVDATSMVNLEALEEELWESDAGGKDSYVPEQVQVKRTVVFDCKVLRKQP